MAKLNPTEAKEKWSRNLKASSEYIRKGVDRVTEAPGVKAAAKADKMRAGVLKALDDGTWQERVASVPLGEWKEKMINKGIPHISAGVDAASGKMDDFFAQLFEHQDRGIDTVQNMPDITLDDSINRMVAWTRHMSNFKRR
jgi:hypothetical protein